jgi:NitT/TauT family transport system ATP-binding protein
MDQMRLRCNSLGVAFGPQSGLVQAVSDLSFETREGEFLSIIGPSGCGKTTLLRTLAGLIRAQKGSVEQVVSPSDCSGRILLVFQEHSLFPWMTVLENAAFGLEMQGVGRAERNRRACKLLDRFGFTGRENAYPHQLSLGMKQRVAVIRAFLSDPAVLLMDEPFAALDCQTRLVVQQELLQLWEQDQKSVIFVTHDLEEAMLLSDRILVLSPQPGMVIAEFHVPFSRPREASITMDYEFLQLKKNIAARLGLLMTRTVSSSHPLSHQGSLK